MLKKYRRNVLCFISQASVTHARLKHLQKNVHAKTFAKIFKNIFARSRAAIEDKIWLRCHVK